MGSGPILFGSPGSPQSEGMPSMAWLVRSRFDPELLRVAQPPPLLLRTDQTHASKKLHGVAQPLGGFRRKCSCRKCPAHIHQAMLTGRQQGGEVAGTAPLPPFRAATRTLELSMWHVPQPAAASKWRVSTVGSCGPSKPCRLQALVGPSAVINDLSLAPVCLSHFQMVELKVFCPTL